MNTNFTPRPEFDAILDLEQEVRIMQTVQAFRGAGVSDYVATRQDGSAASAKDRLFTAVAALSTEDAAAFGLYRVAAMEV